MGRTKGRVAAVAGFCLFLALILFVTAETVYNMAGDKTLLSVEMRRYASPRITRLPNDDYPEVGKLVADYLTGQTDTFQYYCEDLDGNFGPCFKTYEAAHMADCRELIGLAERLRWIGGIGALVLLAAAVVLRKQRQQLAGGMLTGFGVAAVLVFAVVVWGIFNFDGFFTAFHRLMFTNNGWILNPKTDMLIRLMPAAFFVSMGVRVLLAVMAMALACFSAAMVILKMKNDETGAEA